MLVGAIGSPGEACHAGSPDMNSAVSTREAWDLVGEGGCGPLWESSGPYVEHHLLVLEGKVCSLISR